MKTLVADFKSFLVKGDLVSVAVGLVMALVFAALLKALITDLITPIVALIFGQPSFAGLSFTINSSHFLYGDFLNALITFVATGAAVFFFVVKPFEAFTSRRAKDDAEIKNCPECTTAIPVDARRCPQCTAQLEPAPGVGPGA
ncbi:MAG: MscL family protein [Actinomycetota bacterium]|nr:MscL family protein [Actinomycetota bacterium]